MVNSLGSIVIRHLMLLKQHHALLGHKHACMRVPIRHRWL